MERQIFPDEYYRSRERKWSLQTVNGLVREEIRTKAIKAFMDHIYAALEEATKHSGGRSPIVMNKSPTSTWRIDPLRNLRHWRKWDSWSSLFWYLKHGQQCSSSLHWHHQILDNFEISFLSSIIELLGLRWKK